MGITLLHEDPSAHAPRTKTMFTCRIGIVLSFYPAERNIVVVLESTTTTVWKYDKVSIFPLSSYLVVNDMFVPLFEHEGFCQQTNPTTIWNLNLGVANRTFLYHFSIPTSVCVTSSIILQTSWYHILRSIPDLLKRSIAFVESSDSSTSRIGLRLTTGIKHHN